MKTITIFLVIITFSFTVFAQTDSEYPRGQHPILLQLKKKPAQLVAFYKRDSATFITTAVLDKMGKKLYWFDTFGYCFNAVPVSNENIQSILTRKISAFEYYDLLSTNYLQTIRKAISNLRANGHAAKFTSYENQLLQISDSIKYPSTLKKIIALDKQKLSVERQLKEFHSINPSSIINDTSFSNTIGLPYGAMKTLYGPDTITTYYNRTVLQPVYKAILRHSTGNLAFYNRQGRLIDELQLNFNKVTLLADEKTDVFLLYRGWLELERFHITEDISNLKKLEKEYKKIRQENDSYEIISAGNSLRFLQDYTSLVLQKIDRKIEYFTTVDREFVSQCLKMQYLPITGSPEGGQDGITRFTRGEKFYELTDARANVMTVVTDRKIQHSSNGTTIDYYEPDIVAASDYAPFGMALPGRNYQSEKYRYGYNGKENDDEVKGRDNLLNYGARIYDPRLGRFLSVDPLSRSYPFYTPYQFAGNTPIQAIDLDGLEPEFIIDKQGKLTKPMIALFNAAFAFSEVEMQNTHWKKASTSFNAQTIYHTIKYGSRTDLDKFESTEMWTDFWFNLTVHENRHRTEYSGLGSWLKWSASYLAMTAIKDSKEHDDKFYSHDVPAEKRAYGIEQPMVDVMNFQNSLALKTLESNYDDNTKVGIMRYVGTAYNLKNAQSRLAALNEKRATFDGSKGQSRKLDRQIKRQEKVVKGLSAETDKLKTQYSAEIAELDKKQGREVKLVASPTK